MSVDLQDLKSLQSAQDSESGQFSIQGSPFILPSPDSPGAVLSSAPAPSSGASQNLGHNLVDNRSGADSETVEPSGLDLSHVTKKKAAPFRRPRSFSETSSESSNERPKIALLHPLIYPRQGSKARESDSESRHSREESHIPSQPASRQSSGPGKSHHHSSSGSPLRFSIPLMLPSEIGGGEPASGGDGIDPPSDRSSNCSSGNRGETIETLRTELITQKLIKGFEREKEALKNQFQSEREALEDQRRSRDMETVKTVRKLMDKNERIHKEKAGIEKELIIIKQQNSEMMDVMKQFKGNLVQNEEMLSQLRSRVDTLEKENTALRDANKQITHTWESFRRVLAKDHGTLPSGSEDPLRVPEIIEENTPPSPVLFSPVSRATTITDTSRSSQSLSCESGNSQASARASASDTPNSRSTARVVPDKFDQAHTPLNASSLNSRPDPEPKSIRKKLSSWLKRR